MIHPLVDLPLRAVAAITGGYALANLAALALTMALPFARLDVLISTFLYAAAVIWVFAVRSVWHAIVGLASVGLILAALAWFVPGIRT